MRKPLRIARRGDERLKPVLPQGYYVYRLFRSWGLAGAKKAACRDAHDKRQSPVRGH